MNIPDLEAFVAVAELRSIVAAAGKLYLSQSAITRRLQRIEEQLGITLFRRESRPLALTNEGAEAYNHARSVLAAAADLQSSLVRKDSISGALNVGVSVAVGDWVLSHALGILCERYPKLRIRMVSEDSHLMLNRLEKREIDVAIVALPERRALPEGIVGESLATISLVVIAGKNFSFKPGVGIEDLRSQRWVVGPTGCVVREILENALRQSQMRLDVVLECSDLRQKLAFIESGLGVGLYPPHLLRSERSDSTAQIVPLRDFRPRISMWAVHQAHCGRLIGPIHCVRDSFKQNAVEAFAEFDTVSRERRHSEVISAG
jgi:DNA-binding transcriptional LysR family regulator